MKQSSFQFQVEEKLVNTPNLLAPLKVISFTLNPGSWIKGFEPDAELLLGWKEKRVAFFIEMKSRTAPKVVREGIWRLKECVTGGNGHLMIIVPHLSEQIVEMLRETELSGIDLNGNYFIQTDDLVAIRLDRKNQYRESEYIKNIFAGNSSLVARLLLRENRLYEKVGDIYEKIRTLGGAISLGTVSKVLKGLENELIIDRGLEGIRVIQAPKLLEQLRKNYSAPRVTRRILLKLPELRRERAKIFDDTLGKGNWIWSGESSAERYAVTTNAKYMSNYTRSLISADKELKQYEDSRFYNCVLAETRDEFIYFDRNDNWSSKIQCYLELSRLDKREQEIAEEIAKDILGDFA